MLLLPMSVRSVIMSHLSDTQEMIGHEIFGSQTEKINLRINFVKWLLIHFPDTTIEIVPDQQWVIFYKEYLELKSNEEAEAKEENSEEMGSINGDISK